VDGEDDTSSASGSSTATGRTTGSAAGASVSADDASPGASSSTDTASAASGANVKSTEEKLKEAEKDYVNAKDDADKNNAWNKVLSCMKNYAFGVLQTSGFEVKNGAEKLRAAEKTAHLLTCDIPNKYTIVDNDAGDPFFLNCGELTLKTPEGIDGVYKPQQSIEVTPLWKFVRNWRMVFTSNDTPKIVIKAHLGAWKIKGGKCMLLMKTPQRIENHKIPMALYNMSVVPDKERNFQLSMIVLLACGWSVPLAFSSD